MRYKFFREHKFLSFMLNELERLVAKTDFRNPSEVETVYEQFQAVKEMLHSHAQYENEWLFVLLKHSSLIEHLEKDHVYLEEQLEILETLLKTALTCKEEEQLLAIGDQFYLSYRKLVGENLLHLHEEETLFLPELHRLYSDEELRRVEFETYHKMEPQEIIEMLEVLLPHTNGSDHEAFLKDIKEGVPEKFLQVWAHIQSKLSSLAQKNLCER